MKLPKVKREVVHSILTEKFDQPWFEEVFERMNEDNPEVANFLIECAKRDGERLLGCATVLYRLLESQAEADAMNELFV